MQAAAPIIPAGNPVRHALLERQGELTQLHGESSAYTLLGHALRWLGAVEQRGGALGNSSVLACQEVILSMALDYEVFGKSHTHFARGISACDGLRVHGGWVFPARCWRGMVAASHRCVGIRLRAWVARACAMPLVIV